MANVKIPFVGYYALLGSVIFFSFLTWVLSWAAVGRISSFSGYFYYDGGDRGTAAVSALMAVIAMVNQAFAVYDVVKTSRGSDQISPVAISHWRSVTLLTLTALLAVFVIVCGAVSGASGWINYGVVGAYVAFAILTVIVNVLWFFAVRLAVFTHDNNAPTSATKDVEMAVTNGQASSQPEKVE